MERIVEICCGGYEDALAAFYGGAKRIELNSALYLGGLTPSVGALRLTKKNTDLKVIAMVRPRGAGFCYSGADFETMKADAELLLENGADGIAFGCLCGDGSIQTAQTRQMLEIIKRHGGEAVFHRAFDCTPDPYAAIEELIGLGADRILTSGQKAKAMEGLELLTDLLGKYGNQIELLAGSGINASNAKELMDRTGICQVHSSCKGWKNDPTTTSPEVSYSYGQSPYENGYDVVDASLVKALAAKTGETCVWKAKRPS